MSQIRHFSTADENSIALRTLALGLPSGMVFAAHAHPWAQLIYATHGVLTITTNHNESSCGVWVVPSHRAAWIPGGVIHQLEATGKVHLRTVYVRPGLGAQLPKVCCVMGVSPLLRELVLATITHGMLRDTVPEHWRLAQVLLDQLASTPEVPLDLRRPHNTRANRIADAVLADLSGQTSLAQLATDSGASVRTLERLFQAQTGISFGRWRQRARLLQALRLLAAGNSVTATALAVGYDSTSAFVAAFRRTLGATPGTYFGNTIADR